MCRILPGLVPRVIRTHEDVKLRALHESALYAWAGALSFCVFRAIFRAMFTPQFAVFWAQYRKTIVAIILTGGVAVLGLLLGIEGKVVAAVATLVGLLTSVFTGIVGLLSLIPWIGPILLKVLSLPVVWLMNGAGYFAAFFLTSKGHGRAVIDSRIITVTLLVGIVIGYIIGKII